VFAFLLFFRSSACHSSLGGLSYIMPYLHHSSSIVFLDTLGTMCYSLGGGVDISVLLFDCLCCLFLLKKKKMLCC
jgi:hypothetical protein